uniref:Uncharacterized protein n=1 Tax=Lepeophtheirus salmonis TaxID=72036 RepID=A0A0K2U1W1_LEPSM
MAKKKRSYWVIYNWSLNVMMDQGWILFRTVEQKRLVDEPNRLYEEICFCGACKIQKQDNSKYKCSHEQ